MPQNCAAVLHGGRVVARYAKHHLPNYGVFDEFRIFVPGHDLTVVRVRGVDIALAICEDLWQDGGPVAKTRAAGRRAAAGASTARRTSATRTTPGCALAARRAAEAGCPLAYLNLVGGQDELVFDGDSLVVDVRRRGAGPRAAVRRGPARRRPRPRRRARSTRVRPAARRARWSPVTPDPLGRLPSRGRRRCAAAPGRRRRGLCRAGDRAARLRPQERLPLGGARACPAGSTRRWWRPRRRRPRRRATWSASRCPAATPASTAATTPPTWPSGSARTTGSQPIAPMVARLPGRAGAHRRRRGEPPGPGARRDPDGAVQPRGPPGAGDQQQERAGRRLLDAVRRQRRRLRPAQGRAEDARLGAGPLAQRRGRCGAARSQPIPESSIVKPPSAELRPGQTDQDTLPPYDVLDPVLEAYVERARVAPSWSPPGSTPAVVDQVVTMVDRAEWKRRQFAPGPKISAAGVRPRPPAAGHQPVAREHES